MTKVVLDSSAMGTLSIQSYLNHSNPIAQSSY